MTNGTVQAQAARKTTDVMRPIPADEIQPLLLSMLRAFVAYCETHQIKYFATGGTLLGAVRHQGFIPWDDDVDLFIRQEEADRLLALAEKDPFIDAEKRYKILLPAKSPNVYPTIKLVDEKTIVYEKNIDKKYACGLWLDIFKITYWPDDLHAAERLVKKQRRLKKMVQLSIFGNLKDKKYKLIAPLAMPAQRLLLALGKNSDYWSGKLYRLGSRTPTGYIGHLCWTDSIKERYPADWWNDRDILYLPFEDVTLPAPAAYDKILTQFYRDYMQLPPEDQRIRHGYDAYYLDEEPAPAHSSV